jgi:hypothetical protein
MFVPLLDDQRGEFDQRNLLLQLALGLLSAGDELERLIDLRAEGAAESPPPPGDDALTHLVLGLLSLRTTVGRQLEFAGREAPELPAPPVEPGAAHPRVLR